MASVELRNVTKRFGETVVIDNLSLAVEANEFMVFLGPSGCGKSTLLRMIAGLESVDEGEILIDGERVDHLPPGARGVAMVFQHYALYPHMTIRQNMAFGLENIGIDKSEIERRVAESAEILEISALLDRKPTQLSGGQRQRVAIGRAIVKEPKVFLFDEPLSNLDAGLRARTRVELAQLHQRMRSTMIFVTHDQIEAMTLADRIVLMNNRQVEQLGRPIDIYRNPATEFVAGFVGSPKINIIPVSVAAAAGTISATLRNGAVIDTRIPAAEMPSGDDCRLGIRPEEITIAAPQAGQLTGRAAVVERLGDRTMVHVALSEGTLIVAVDSPMSSVDVGDEVGLDVAGARIHLFGADGRAHHAAQTDPQAVNG